MQPPRDRSGTDFAAATAAAVREVFADSATVVEMRAAPCPEAPLSPGILQPAVDAVDAGERVVVVVSDHTRKTGAAAILPMLLDGWRQRGVRPEDIAVLIACGSHRAPTPDEVGHILGPPAMALVGNRIVIHDAFRSDCVPLGRTSRGTPVAVNRLLVETPAVVTIGGVVFHYFAGFTGGRKSIVPGAAAAATIAANHSLTIAADAGTFHPAVQLGRLAGNPVAEDLEEAAAFVPVRGSVQTVLDGTGRLAGVFTGSLAETHRQACNLARRLFACTLAAKADVVVASAGAARNWVQSHKALVNASRAVREDGVIVLDAPCPEALGSQSLEQWLRRRTPSAIIAGIAESADINAQTALSTLLRGRQTVLVTQMTADAAALTGMRPAATLPEALRQAADRLPPQRRPHPSVLLMPEAWLTVPA
ncbi:MAG: hypothetical protein BWZ02_00138 [Lentisphaerae bacterium ADurb.BinA184]|nr:MAG: hypothetical protein BWZ02_00138 [Lentisphaerae bacterium ADurb.BinA184]